MLATTALAVAQRGAAPADLPTVDAAAMLKTAKPDLAARLAQFKQVRMPYDPSPLTANERQMIDQLVAASRALESMYWRQSDPVGLAFDGITFVARRKRRDLLDGEPPCCPRLDVGIEAMEPQRSQ